MTNILAAFVLRVLPAVVLVNGGVAVAEYFEFSYQGAPFDSSAGGRRPGGAVSARFVLDLPNAANLPLRSYATDLVGGALLVSDGVRTLATAVADPVAFPIVTLATDGLGAPANWHVAVDTIDASQAVSTESTGCAFSGLGAACDFVSAGNTPVEWVVDMPGVWAVSTLAPGDYSRDASVDAADYTVWRDSLGRAGVFQAADGNLDGVVDQLDLHLWRDNYGAAAPSGSIVQVTVPAPEANLLLFVGLLTAAAYAPRRGLSATLVTAGEDTTVDC